MTSRERIQDLWWSGIRLWYNEQEFLEAMQTWQQAIDSVDLDDDSAEDQNEIFPKGDASLEESFLAPIMLFMAGCYLDAGDAKAAQALCRRILNTTIFRRSLLGEINDDFAFCAISEYTSTFQEDPSVEAPWKIAYQIADWAIQEQIKQALSSLSLTKSALWLDPYQRPGFLYTPLPSKAVYRREEHPTWCRKVEEHYPIIREEYQRLMQSRSNISHTSQSSDLPQHWPCVGAGDHREGAGAHDSSVVQGGDWREIVLFGSGARPDLAPRTSQILQQYAPEAVDLAREGAGEIIFSALAANTHIAPHCASTNIRLTAHLGLQIPKDCYIQVANETLNWEEGKIIVFDDSFQHEVHNHSNGIRAVLLLRFWHFNLPSDDRQKALQDVLNAKEKDRLRRCNPPLPPNGERNPQGMESKLCPNCGRNGFETVRLVCPEDQLFSCVCGREIS